MGLLSSRRVFVYDQVLLSQVKSQLAKLCKPKVVHTVARNGT